MSVPFRVDDGRFTDPFYQVGSDEWATPFSDRGDQLTFELMRRYRVDHESYKRAPFMMKLSTEKGDCYLVHEDEARDVGGGLLEVKRTFSSIPKTRREGTSLTYPLQFVSNGELIEFPINGMTADAVWEYFKGKPAAIVAPKIIEVGGTFYAIGGWGEFTAGQQYAAEDSTVDIYKAGIYYRRTVYITWPTITNPTP